MSTVLVVLATVAASCGPTSPRPGKIPLTTKSRRAQAAYIKARDLMENLRVAESREHFATALRHDPFFALAHLGMAASAPSSTKLFGPLRRAMQLADAASQGEAMLIKAFDAQVHGRPEEQRELLHALVKAYPGDERAHDELGDFHFRRDELEEAATEYLKAVAINPEFSPPYNYLGYSYRFLGRLDQAEEAFRTYITLLPHEPNPYDSYAELLMQRGRFRDSIAQYEKALNINPSFAPSYIGIGNDHIFLGEFQHASNAFIKLRFIARNEGERRQAIYWLAAVALHQGQTTAALAEIENAMAIAKANEDGVAEAADLATMGDILLDAGQPDAALARYRESLVRVDTAVTPSEIKEFFHRAFISHAAHVAIAKGDLATAAARTQEFRRQADVHAMPSEIRTGHELAGLLALAQGDPTTAVKELQSAGQFEARVRFELYQAQAAAGDMAAAHSTLLRVVNFNAIDMSYAFVRTKALAAFRDWSRKPETSQAHQ